MYKSYLYKKSRNYKLSVYDVGVIRESLEYFKSNLRKAKDYKMSNKVYRVRRLTL